MVYNGINQALIAAFLITLLVSLYLPGSLKPGLRSTLMDRLGPADPYVFSSE
jgi:hypothetical protein